MSAPILTLLKRSDELHVVEQAHVNPRFVEDVGARYRRRGRGAPGARGRRLRTGAQRNFETIHAHDVIAERTGLLGELRAELAGGDGGSHRRSTTGCAARQLRAPKPEAALGSGAEAGDVRPVENDDADCAIAPKATTARLAEPNRQNGRRTRLRSTRTTRSGRAGTRRARARPRRPSSGAAPKNTPPPVATVLPPFSKRRKSGRQWPSIAAPPARTPALADESDPDECRQEALAKSSNTSGMPRLFPYVRQTFVAPMLPLPTLRMSSPLKSRTSQYPNGTSRAGTAEDDEGRSHVTALTSAGSGTSRPSRSRPPSRGC